MVAKKRGRFRNPKQSASPPEKSIRRSEEPAKFQNIKAAWAVSRLDREGDWGWDNVTLDDLWLQIIPKLKAYENMNWADIITDRKSHNISTDELIPKARRRLKDIGLGGLDELFSLRLTGLRRIWGILDKGVLKIVWYDPRHEVRPAPLKHT